MLLSVAMTMVVALSATAGDYERVVLHGTDGTDVYVSASNLKITFEDGQLVALDKSTNTRLSSLSVSALSYMQFTNTGGESSIGNITIDGVSSDAVYYTLSGLQVSVPTTSGIYIVKQNGKTFKVVVK